MKKTRTHPDELIIGLVSISDRASTGVYEDQGVPALRDWFTSALTSPWQMETRLIPDEQPVIEKTLIELVDAGLVDPKEAFLRAIDKATVGQMLKAHGHDVSFLDTATPNAAQPSRPDATAAGARPAPPRPGWCGPRGTRTSSVPLARHDAPGDTMQPESVARGSLKGRSPFKLPTPPAQGGAGVGRPACTSTCPAAR